MSASAIGKTLTVSRGGERVNRVSTIVELCLVVTAGVLFNLFPARIGYYVSLAEPWRFTPLLAPEFSAHLPALNLYWTLACNLCIANLVLLRWNVYTRSADAALKFLGVIIMLLMVVGGPLTLYPWLDQLLKLALAIAAIPAFISAISAARRVVGAGVKSA